MLHIARSKSRVLFETHDLLQIPMMFNQREVILATFGLSRIPLNNICVPQLFKISGGALLLRRLKADEKKFGKPVRIFDKNRRPNHAKQRKIRKPK